MLKNQQDSGTTFRLHPPNQATQETTLSRTGAHLPDDATRRRQGARGPTTWLAAGTLGLKGPMHD